MTEAVMSTNHALFASQMKQTTETHGSALMHGSLVREIFATWDDLKRTMDIVGSTIKHDDLLDLVTFRDAREGEVLPDACPFPSLMPSKNRWRKLKRYGNHVIVEEVDQDPEVPEDGS